VYAFDDAFPKDLSILLALPVSCTIKKSQLILMRKTVIHMQIDDLSHQIWDVELPCICLAHEAVELFSETVCLVMREIYRSIAWKIIRSIHKYVV
jgi:hypothetical protein